MPRSLVLANDHMLVALDSRACVRDIYYPHIGEEDHIGPGESHRIGVHVNGTTSWLDSDDWRRTLRQQHDSGRGLTIARHAKFGITLTLSDMVLRDANVFVRDITVTNEHDHEQHITLFFAHQFTLRETCLGDTGFYDPTTKSVIHYEGDRAFLAHVKGNTVDDVGYTIGNFDIRTDAGSHHDASDGKLEYNPVEHGHVDSVLSKTLMVPGRSDARVDYRLIAALSIDAAREIFARHDRTDAPTLQQQSHMAWRVWRSQGRAVPDLPKLHSDLFDRSLVILKEHMDESGCVIASCDSGDSLSRKDTYAYMWPRDAAWAVMALDKMGFTEETKSYFEFIRKTLSHGGYLLHKFRPSGTLGSSWHPWIIDGSPITPIQEDQLALVLIALDSHLRLTHERELAIHHYNDLVRPASEFISSYRDLSSGLPHPSFDLWEQDWGVSLYTSLIAAEGLYSSSRIADLVGRTDDAYRYRAVSGEIRSAVKNHFLQSGQAPRLLRVGRGGGKEQVDDRTDMATFWALSRFGTDTVPADTLKRYEERVRNDLTIEPFAYARYSNDTHMRLDDGKTGNPWSLATLIMAMHKVLHATSSIEIDDAWNHVRIIEEHTTPSGLISEQYDPNTLEPFGATPLVWSHAYYILTMIALVNRQAQLEQEN